MKTLWATLVAGMTAMTALPAFAAGPSEPVVISEPAEVVAVAYGKDWTGGYVGAELGWGWLDSTNDGLGGFYAGYRADYGDWVLGGEVSYDWSNISGDDVKLDALGAIKFKAGYDLGTSLVYGLVGASYADVDLTTRNSTGGNDWGWQIGAGLEYMVTDTVSVAGEVIYNDFSNFDGSGIDFNLTTLAARVAYNF